MGLKRIRRIVLVGHDNEGSARLFEKVTSSYPEAEFLLVLGKGLYHGRSFSSSVVTLLREASWIFVFVRFLELVRFKLTKTSLKQLAVKKGIRVLATDNINSPEMLAKLREFAPDLLVSLFTMQIYKQPVLDIAKFGSITSHPSILPHYRGLEVFFWVLANDEKETGVSVFFLAEKIDAGKVFEQERVTIHPHETVSSLYRRITDIGGELLVRAIKHIDADQLTFIPPQEGPGSYYRMPTRESMRRFLKLGKKFS